MTLLWTKGICYYNHFSVTTFMTRVLYFSTVLFLSFWTVTSSTYSVKNSPPKSFLFHGELQNHSSITFYQLVFVCKLLPLFLRTKLSLPEKTVSLWSWVNRPQELERLTNPLYESNSLVIWPSVAPQSLLLWEGKRNQTHFITHCLSMTVFGRIKAIFAEFYISVYKCFLWLVCSTYVVILVKSHHETFTRLSLVFVCLHLLGYLSL